MNALILAATLAAAPLLQPDPGGFKRLQPRQLDASSFLVNGWNKFEQNYLPLYIADDDPSTAWVEGAAGPGVGESVVWFGPALKKARAFRIFIRSGYQKSKALFEANARPRKIRLEPLIHTEAGVASGGKPVEVELGNVLGWQKLELPVPAAVIGFRLTVLSAYAGTKYDDLCISDLQVYVDGDDPYSAAMEAKAFEQIRVFAADRKAAATAGATESAVEVAPRYVETVDGKHSQRNPVAARALALAAQEWPELAAVLTRARDAALAYQEGADGALKSHPVRVAQGVKGLSSRNTALAAAIRGDAVLGSALGYLAVKDLAIFEQNTADPVADAQAALLKLAETEPVPPDCAARCAATLKPLVHPEQGLACLRNDDTGDRISSCAQLCAGGAGQACFEGQFRSESRGIWVQGTLAAPTALFRHVEITEGDRDSVTTLADELIAYREGVAQSLLTVRTKTAAVDDPDDIRTVGSTRIYLLDWAPGTGKRKLARLYRVTVDGTSVRVSHFDAA